MQSLNETVPMTWRLSSDKRSTEAETASASFVPVCCCLCLWITYRSSMRSRWILSASTPTGFLSREGSKCWTAASTCQFEKNHKGHSSTCNWKEQCRVHVSPPRVVFRENYNWKHFKSLRQMQTAFFQKMCHQMSHQGFLKVVMSQLYSHCHQPRPQHS